MKPKQRWKTQVTKPRLHMVLLWLNEKMQRVLNCVTLNNSSNFELLCLHSKSPYRHGKTQTRAALDTFATISRGKTWKCEPCKCRALKKVIFTQLASHCFAPFKILRPHASTPQVNSYAFRIRCCQSSKRTSQETPVYFWSVAFDPFSLFLFFQVTLAVAIVMIIITIVIRQKKKGNVNCNFNLLISRV